MTRIERLRAAAEALTDEQFEALIAFAQSMRGRPYFEDAPAEALASIERGLAQHAAGESVTLEELSRRLDAAAKGPQG